MGNRLFVGGLAWATTDDSLKSYFEQIGEVTDAKVVTDRGTGRSRGFGFVTFAEASNASSAMESLNETDLDGRTIRVDVATERKNDGGNRGPRGGNRDRGGDRW